jgi:SAM-dependent methyltransferase
MGEQAVHPGRPNYGIDAPTLVRNFALLGVAGVLLLPLKFLVLDQPGWWDWIIFPGATTGLYFLLTAGVMVWGSKVGKLRLRDRFLDGLGLRGDETVLDVGCGRGLMLLGVARRLKQGKAIGVDIWQTVDQSGNRPEATWENARREGVADRVEIRDGDARKLPFSDATFDVIVSSWALHNIYNAPEREQALREIVRVLKPGGRLGIVDIHHTAEYARVLTSSGLTGVVWSRPNFLFVIPTRIVTGKKPDAGG